MREKPVLVKWVDLLMEEFWNQGDKEKQQNLLPVSFLCDRDDADLPKG